MNESQLKSIPTLVLGDLPPPERDHYFKFLLENEVQFVEDEYGYFVAVIRVINPKRKIYLVNSTTKTNINDKQRLLQSTFSYKQKIVSHESPKEDSTNSRKKSKTPERKRNITPFKPDFSPNQMKGISELLEQDSSFAKSGENTLRTKTPDKVRENPIKLFLKNTKFQNLVSLAKIQATTGLRPKTLSIANLIKVIEEIYNAKYKQDTLVVEEEIMKKSSSKQLSAFPDFICDFFNEKYKNKRMVDQSLLDLCQSVENFDNDYIEVKIFSNFLSQNLDSEDLIFFLFIRNTIQKVLGIQFAPKYPGQKISEDTRSIFLNLKQCIKVTNAVFADEESLQRAFLGQIEKIMENSEGINVAAFMELFLETYHEVQPGQNMINSNLSPFHSDSESPKQGEDTFAESMIHHENIELDGESEILKSLDMGSMLKNVLSNQIKENPPTLPDRRTPDPPRRETPTSMRRSPLDDLKKACIEYSETHVIEQFVNIILKGLTDVPRPQLSSIRSNVISFLALKMNSLLEALFSFDKRKWLETLETDNKDCLKYVEGLQKQVRDISRGMITEEDIDSICKSILQTPELKKMIGSYITDISQKIANKW